MLTFAAVAGGWVYIPEPDGRRITSPPLRGPPPLSGEACLAEFALARRHMFRIIRFSLKG